ncbi:MAG TPA: hypothetical protein VK190_11230 [Pseudoneobacillus sp.]|nr:hypothetical protein [Pseudoneobacillus sp.]
MQSYLLSMVTAYCETHSKMAEGSYSLHEHKYGSDLEQALYGYYYGDARKLEGKEGAIMEN